MIQRISITIGTKYKYIKKGKIVLSCGPPTLLNFHTEHIHPSTNLYLFFTKLFQQGTWPLRLQVGFTLHRNAEQNQVKGGVYKAFHF